MSLEKLTYNLGESGSIRVENVGGVDTEYDYRLKIVDLKNVLVLQQTGAVKLT